MAGKLQFKVRPGVDPPARDRLVRALRAAGARDVRRLLPDETDPELASLYTVECGEAEPEDLLQRLRSSPEVEFVEHSPKRGPVGRA
ncbi:MAG TPA: hypothetical protein VFR85_03960 [Anaeromyxobacteraceae bacterium]|nr:hypothetical protein [Anaeromyxobacteraceae bacterium]